MKCPDCSLEVQYAGVFCGAAASYPFANKDGTPHTARDCNANLRADLAAERAAHAKKLRDDERLMSEMASDRDAAITRREQAEQRCEEQRKRIVYLEGATNHATGTPLSHAEQQVAALTTAHNDLRAKLDAAEAERDTECAEKERLIALVNDHRENTCRAQVERDAANESKRAALHSAEEHLKVLARCQQDLAYAKQNAEVQQARNDVLLAENKASTEVMMGYERELAAAKTKCSGRVADIITLMAERDRLREQLSDAKVAAMEFAKTANEQIAGRDRECERLRWLLAKYGKHLLGCAKMHDHGGCYCGNCTCGLEEALTAPDAGAKVKP